MKNFLPLLCSTSLFNGLTPEELQTLLAQLGSVMRSYGKGEALVLAGEPNRRVGIVLSGELEAYRPAPGGVRIPIAQVEPPGQRCAQGGHRRRERPAREHGQVPPSLGCDGADGGQRPCGSG